MNRHFVKSEKSKMSKKENQPDCNSYVEGELEDQFIIRFPEDMSNSVQEYIEEGNIHEKLTIQLDNELRLGEVKLDNQLLYAKVVDLPTVVESYKTADNVNLYKTADISQMVVCMTEPDKVKNSEKIEAALEAEKELERMLGLLPDSEDNAEDAKGKKPGAKDEIKDLVTVDDKFLWPHGIAPPFRNLRKRRLNNAMKDKNGNLPEADILRDVKYLLRMDSEAVRVEYALINNGQDFKSESDLSTDSDSDSNSDSDSDTPSPSQEEI